MLQPGSLIENRYQVESLIAQGGMGSVYKVRDRKLGGKLLAVKEVVHANHDRFLEEARILTQLSHPHIPKITDYFEPDADGRCYLVMEYVRGTTLQAKFEQAGHSFPYGVTVKYMSQLCGILDYLHHQPTPIIFRDLKPANIMIDEFDNVQLIDFGIARNFDRAKLADTVQMGTIAFAAPEQFDQTQTDERTDIYAVGSVMYYLMSGGKYVYQNSGSLSSAIAHLPEQLRDLILQLIDPDPQRRPQQIGKVKERLDAVQQPHPQLVHAAVAPAQRTEVLRAEDRPPALAVERTAHLGGDLPIGAAAAYTRKATQSHPALVIYLLDVSGSMSLPLGGRKRIDVVSEALNVALRQMVFRSTKGSRISSRYRVAIIAYSDEVHDLLGGIRPIDELMNTGQLPVLQTHRFSDTASAFLYAEQLIKAELPSIQDCPAPLVCHMTDGVYTGEDPEPIARRLMNLSVKDGSVLVENIFISDHVLEQEIELPKRWPGIRDNTAFKDAYGEKLRRMSSVIPESYRGMMRESNYNLALGSMLMFPGTSPDLVSLGFQMSAATPIH